MPPVPNPQECEQEDLPSNPYTRCAWCCRSLGGLNTLEPRQRPVQSQRSQQQPQIIALVRQSTGVPDVLGLHRLARLLGQIIRSEQDVPESELDAVIARIPITFGNLGGMMPAVHFRRDKEIVENSAFDVGAAVRKHLAELSRGDGKKNRDAMKAEDTKHEKDNDITKREIDRVGDHSIRGRQVRDPVMIGVELP